MKASKEEQEIQYGQGGRTHKKQAGSMDKITPTRKQSGPCHYSQRTSTTTRTNCISHRKTGIYNQRQKKRKEKKAWGSKTRFQCHESLMKYALLHKHRGPKSKTSDIWSDSTWWWAPSWQASTSPVLYSIHTVVDVPQERSINGNLASVNKSFIQCTLSLLLFPKTG